MEPLRLGIVGCGVIANNGHLPGAAASSLVRVVAVADTQKERAEAAAQKWTVRKVYTSAEALFADPEAEAVVLALPTGLRHALSCQALAHGKHVLTEKPVAMSLDEVREQRRRAGNLVVACCSSRFTFNESADVAAKCVASGALGSLRVVRARNLLAAPKAPEKTPPPWRQSFAQNGGGILVNWGCYDLDYLMYVTGWKLRPKTVQACIWPAAEIVSDRVAAGSDADSHYHVMVRCEGDILLSLERGEFTSTQTEEHWSVMGSDGTLHLDMQWREKKLCLDRIDRQQGVQREVIWQGNEENTCRRSLLEDFAKAIREKRPPRTDLQRAGLMQAITDAVYQSARTGKAADVNW